MKTPAATSSYCRAVYPSGELCDGRREASYHDRNSDNYDHDFAVRRGKRKFDASSMLKALAKRYPEGRCTFIDREARQPCGLPPVHQKHAMRLGWWHHYQNRGDDLRAIARGLSRK